MDVKAYDDHVERLQRQLRALDRERRLAFAMWCCYPFWSEYSAELSKAIGVSVTHEFSRFMDSMLEYLMRHTMPHEVIVSTVRIRVAWFGSDDADDIDTGDQDTTEHVITLLCLMEDLLNVFATDSVEAASGCARNIFNYVYNRAADACGSDRVPLEQPMTQNEIMAQCNFVEVLAGCQDITEVESHIIVSLARRLQWKLIE